MEKYKFLYKPLFYIFSLLFSCWMVLKIEHISPSDFGKYRSLFEPDKKTKEEKKPREELTLRYLYWRYKNGLIDSSTFFGKLEQMTEMNNEIPVDKNERVQK